MTQITVGDYIEITITNPRNGKQQSEILLESSECITIDNALLEIKQPFCMEAYHLPKYSKYNKLQLKIKIKPIVTS